MQPEALPVPVLEHPRWRVVLRPDEFHADRIPTLSQCWDLVQKSTIRLRGWPYPVMLLDHSNRISGVNWVGFHSQFAGHIEYWRLYQSGQFVYLGTVREKTNVEWDAKLRKEAAHHFGRFAAPDLLPTVPGFLHIANTIYTVTEYLEFAGRMCENGLFDRSLSIAIELHDVKGFVLTADPMAAWWLDHQCTCSFLGRSWAVAATEMISNRTTLAVDALMWFFERFGWINATPETLRDIQQRFLAGRG